MKMRRLWPTCGAARPTGSPHVSSSFMKANISSTKSLTSLVISTGADFLNRMRFGYLINSMNLFFIEGREIASAHSGDAGTRGRGDTAREGHGDRLPFLLSPRRRV